jgi:hypothetical protein
MSRVILAIFCLVLNAGATERIAPRAQLLSEGYAPIIYSKTDSAPSLDSLPTRSLPWPLHFEDSSHTIANSMAQYQPFDEPAYFHGGLDLRTKLHEAFFAPVAGRLEAGHYGYSTNPDGSMEKYWKPWPQSGDATYFEVAVIDDQGFRFEFHHVDRQRLPQKIVSLLNQGGARVEAGEQLGDTVFFSSSYHHIHYNVVAPNGIRVNPESLHLPIPDHQAPTVFGVFARAAGASKFMRLEEGKSLAKTPEEIVVFTNDKLDGSVYDQPPVLVRVEFSSGETVQWDFRRALATGAGNFPNLFHFISEEISVEGEGRLQSTGGYGVGKSLIRLRVPASAKGAYTITLEDISGNAATFRGEIAVSN